MLNRLNRQLILEWETHPHIRLADPTRQLVGVTESVAPSAVLDAGTVAVVELVGPDRPGLLHGVLGVGHYPKSAEAVLPSAVSLAARRADLEKIAVDPMLDLEVPSAKG